MKCFKMVIRNAQKISRSLWFRSLSMLYTEGKCNEFPPKILAKMDPHYIAKMKIFQLFYIPEFKIFLQGPQKISSRWYEVDWI